jgi:hypothetical protein
MKRISMTLLAAVCLAAGAAHAQTNNDDAAEACQSTGLKALQERSSAITDLVLDMETLAVSSADTKVGNVPVKTVVMGDAYIARGGETGKPDRFVCLLGDEGKVLLTFFTAQ